MRIVLTFPRSHAFYRVFQTNSYSSFTGCFKPIHIYHLHSVSNQFIVIIYKVLQNNSYSNLQSVSNQFIFIIYRIFQTIHFNLLQCVSNEFLFIIYRVFQNNSYSKSTGFFKLIYFHLLQGVSNHCTFIFKV